MCGRPIHTGTQAGATLPTCRIHTPPGGTPIAEFDVLRSKVDSTFHLVHLAAKRAREINSYYAHIGEGLTAYVPPLMAVDSNKALSIALEEIAADKVVAVEASDAVAVDPLSFIELDDDGAAQEAVESLASTLADLNAIPDADDPLKGLDGLDDGA
jgi:DNA-directed RNA polymerase subunit omega